MNTKTFALMMTLLAASGAAHVPAARADFRSDVALLKQHPGVIVLSAGQAEVAVVPAYQARVMTSTAGGGGGDSYGWLNRTLIASGKIQPHFNAFGGEDRIWFGPEGGQFGLFFGPGAPFDMAHWETPAPVDTQSWSVTGRSRRTLSFGKTITVTNRHGTRFHFRAARTVRLLLPAELRAAVGAPISPGVHAVGYETDNRITNLGPQAWQKNSGLISIWILGQYNPSPTATIVIPFKPGPVARLGRVANDAYFGKVPPDRLIVNARRGVLFFKADGKHRSKIGIGPNRVRDILGSYDPAHRVLTLIRFSLPPAPARYVNSMWEVQKDPLGGDVANSYNDGPLATGGQLGPFYELESSSPAAALAPGRSQEHRRTTIHLQGPAPALDAIAIRTLGVHLSDITNAFGKGGVSRASTG